MSNKVWRRHNDKEILISDMSNGHINNAIKKIKRENKDYKTLDSYLDLMEELNNRKQATINRFNNEKLNDEYKRLYKELNSIDCSSIYGNMQYEIQKARIEGFVKACEILE